MICFLTSSVVIPGTNALNPANGFLDELRRRFPEPCRALFVCSDPDHAEVTDFYAGLMRESFEDVGLRIDGFTVLDRRNQGRAAALVRASNLLILAGGHVPTQNRFLHEIGLRDALRGFDGVIVGVSAGSMNSAEVVYAQPEMEGEVLDPDYRRYLTGLGLTRTMLLPHYQLNKDDRVDGLRVYEDIACPDSYGRTFYAIPDGSYLLIEPGREALRGEAYAIAEGGIRRIAGEGDVTWM